MRGSRSTDDAAMTFSPIHSYADPCRRGASRQYAQIVTHIGSHPLKRVKGRFQLHMVIDVASPLFRRYEPRVFQNLEMMHHSRAAKRGRRSANGFDGQPLPGSKSKSMVWRVLSPRAAKIRATGFQSAGRLGRYCVFITKYLYF